MHAVVMHETGAPEVLRYEEAERPEPGDGQVLIRVRAAAVNAFEWKQRRGLVEKKLPAVLGSDVSGTVELSRAEGWAAGDDVFGFAASGAYAEFATASGVRIARKPAGVGHEQAAALPVAGLTAWQALFDHGALQPGQTVLIAGAAGGVGHLAVQLARHAGARAIGIGSGRNRDFVLGLGAEGYVDYTQQDVARAAAGVDLAVDAVGGDTTRSLLGALRPGGLLVTIANAPPEEAAREREVRAATMSMRPDAGQLDRLGRLVADGELRVEIAEPMPITEIRRAHELIESGHVRGKLVLRVEE